MKAGNITEDRIKNIGISKPVLHALIFRVSGLGLIFLLQVLLARLMGPANYGDYTVIITIVNIFIVVSVFGFDSSILRFLPAYIANGDMNKANGFVKFAYRFIILASLLCSTGLFVFLLFKAKKFGLTFAEGFLWGLLIVPFQSFIYLSSSVLRAFGKVKSSLASAYFLIPFSLGISCLWYYSNHHKLAVDAAMLIYLCCCIVISVFINKRAAKVVKERVESESVSYKRMQWVSVSSVLFLTTALDLLLRQSDILLVSYFLGNTKAGIYGVAAKMSILASLGLSVADYVFMPKISALFESRQFSRLQEMIRNSSLQILSITLPVALALFAGGKWILGMFGNTFQSSYLPLAILLCGQVINATTGMGGGIMAMTGHQKIFFLYYLLAFLIQFTLNIFLIPSFGLKGAAIGSTCSLVLLNILVYRFVKKKLGIKASFF